MHTTNLDPTQLCFPQPHLTSTKDSQNCLNANCPSVLRSLFRLGIWPTSLFLLVAKIILSLLPTSSENCYTPVLRLRAPGVPDKTSVTESFRAVGTIMPSRVTPQTTTNYDLKKTRHRLHPSTKHTMSKFCHVIFLSSPKTVQITRGKLVGSKTKKMYSGRITENTNCRSRVSMCRMCLASSLGQQS